MARERAASKPQRSVTIDESAPATAPLVSNLLRQELRMPSKKLPDSSAANERDVTGPRSLTRLLGLFGALRRRPTA